MRRAGFLFLAFTIVTLVALTSVDSAHGQSKKLHASPPDSVWMYSYWNGESTNDPASENRSERLLAEPEVRAFLDDIIKRIGLIAPAMMLDQPEDKQKLIRSIAPKLNNKLFKNSGSFFIEDMEFDAQQQLAAVKAMMMVEAGEDAKVLADEIAQLMASAEASPSTVTLSGKTFQKVDLAGEQKIELVVGAINGTLILGVGEQTVSEALERISKSKRPEWLTNFKSHKNAKRLTNFSYFNIAKIRDAFAPALDKKAMLAVGAVGLGNVDSIETSAGLNEDQSFTRMLVRTDGPPEGIFDLHAKEELSVNELKHVPADSIFAFGSSIDATKALEFVSLVSAAVSGERGGIERGFARFKTGTGVDLNQEIENLGNVWTLHNGVGDGLLSGLAVTGSVKSGEQLKSAIDEVIKKVIINAPNTRVPNKPVFLKRQFGEDEVFSVALPWGFNDLPVLPSWSISGNRIAIGLFPGAVESVIKENNYSPLVDQAMLDKMSKSFAGTDNAKLVGFSYVDVKSQFPIYYPYMQFSIGMTPRTVSRMNLTSTSSMTVAGLVAGIRLPPGRAIYKHLKPTHSMVRRSEAGIEIEAWQTIPSVDPGFVAPLAVGAILPAMQQLRQKARSTASKNNLRQLALAMHNFESAYRHFPPGYSTDEDGKKLLSWRVHILPFVEQSDLHKQFKLDEPWDSPHNKPLVKKMPELFRSPVSNSKPGTTVYRGVGGTERDGGVLRAPRKNGRMSGATFGNIIDGSSNTILAFETSDSLAQEWTKPDEGLDPFDVDKQGIFGAYPNGTNVAMADGSVQFLLESVNEKALSYLMRAGDGNVVNSEEAFQVPPRFRRNRRKQATEAHLDPFFMIGNGSVLLTAENMLDQGEKADLEMVQQKRDRANALRSIALAMLNYESAYMEFPAAYTTDKTGKPLLSWRVKILPFLDENELFQKFKQDEPWDSDHNKALLSEMPDCFKLDDGQAETGKTTVMGNGGPNGTVPKPPELDNGAHRRNLGVTFGQIADGTSNTVLLINAPDSMAVEWTKPVEFAPDDATLKLILSRQFRAQFTDGSHRVIKKGLSVEKFKAILTRAGGEIINKAELSPQN